MGMADESGGRKGGGICEIIGCRANQVLRP